MKRRLSATFEQRIEKSIKNKKLQAKMLKKVPSLTVFHRMFDHMMILGCSPNDTNHPSPKILVSFPVHSQVKRSDEELELIKSFCFPDGFRPIPEVLKPSRVLLCEFVFFLTESSDRVYGVCVHFQAHEGSFFATHKTRKYPFALVFLTKVPYLSVHFHFASYLALALCDRVKPLEHIEEKQFFPNVGGPQLIDGMIEDQQYPDIAVVPPIAATELLYRELNFYYSIPVYDGANHFEKWPLCDKMVLCINRPLTEPQCLAYPSIHVLFSSLSVKDIIKIYSAILLEQHVLFVSTRMHRLTLVVVAFLSLLSPFKGDAIMQMPVVPASGQFTDLLDAPTPYVCGTVADHSSGDVIVNLDTGSITESFPIVLIPRHSVLEHKLEMLLGDVMESIVVPPRTICPLFGKAQPNPEFQEFIYNISPLVFPYVFTCMTDMKYVMQPSTIDAILDVFHFHLAPHVEDLINECFVTDTTDWDHPVTVCNKDLLMLQVPEKERVFYAAFTQTEMFDLFCDQLTDDFDVKWSQSMDFSQEPVDEAAESTARSCPPDDIPDMDSVEIEYA